MTIKNDKPYSKATIDQWIEKTPLLSDIMASNPVNWLNPEKKSMAQMPDFDLDINDMKEAAGLWERFAPFFKRAFPQTTETEGRIESPFRAIPKMQTLLSPATGQPRENLFLKCDNALPIAGSIKARGGFYEIMQYAEQLAIEADLLSKEDNYAKLASDEFRHFFGRYKIGVGSTGNLGLSIGIISAKLGFEVKVYVSDDAKAWKKNLLREEGVEVLEFEGDFSKAITAGRQKTQADPQAYFVDDEDSKALFTGYSVGALRLADQLDKHGITVDGTHPLFVYSPCGVGGSPGGTAFGLKQIYGDNVHCFFVEPTHCPAVLTGLITGELSQISVQDIGLDNKTEADGLAVGRPSRFATAISRHLISGIYTVDDQTLYRLLAQLKDSEGLFLEPSATPGLIGPQRIAQTDYAKNEGVNLSHGTHVAWATGGDLVPKEQRELFYKKGLSLQD